MDNKQTDITDLSTKVMAGLKKALRNLVEKSAAENRSLVISENGKIKRVPAKELLSSLPL